jgi:hypothetical protein
MIHTINTNGAGWCKGGDSRTNGANLYDFSRFILRKVPLTSSRTRAGQQMSNHGSIAVVKHLSEVAGQNGAKIEALLRISARLRKQH